MKRRIELTLDDGTVRPFEWDDAESHESYEPSVLMHGVLGIYHVTDHPGGDGPRSRLVEAYTRWIKVVTF